MEEFTASNGIKIRVNDSVIEWLASGSDEFEHISLYAIGSKLDVAVSEFYRFREDERLGRWRSKENPGWLVTIEVDEDGDHVVWNESDPTSHRYCHGASGNLSAEGYREAFEEFKRQHTPPIWHEAAEGEVWELEFKAGKHAWFVNGAYFQSTKTLTNVRKDDPDIISARKIYPAE